MKYKNSLYSRTVIKFSKELTCHNAIYGKTFHVQIKKLEQAEIML